MEYSPPVPDYTYTGREQSPRDAGVEEVRTVGENCRKKGRERKKMRETEKSRGLFLQDLGILLDHLEGEL